MDREIRFDSTENGMPRELYIINMSGEFAKENLYGWVSASMNTDISFSL